MIIASRVILEQRLRIHECKGGVPETKPYDDKVGRINTPGKITIGVGRNLTDVGVRPDEIALMLKNDIDEVLADLYTSFPWYTLISDNRQIALADMRFNLGPVRFRGFHKMLAHAEAGEWPECAAEMKNSPWYTEVGPRAIELEGMIIKG